LKEKATKENNPKNKENTKYTYAGKTGNMKRTRGMKNTGQHHQDSV